MENLWSKCIVLLIQLQPRESPMETLPGAAQLSLIPVNFTQDRGKARKHTSFVAYMCSGAYAIHPGAMHMNAQSQSGIFLDPLSSFSEPT